MSTVSSSSLSMFGKFLKAILPDIIQTVKDNEDLSVDELVALYTSEKPKTPIKKPLKKSTDKIVNDARWKTHSEYMDLLAKHKDLPTSVKHCSYMKPKNPNMGLICCDIALFGLETGDHFEYRCKDCKTKKGNLRATFDKKPTGKSSDASVSGYNRPQEVPLESVSKPSGKVMQKPAAAIPTKFEHALPAHCNDEKVITRRLKSSQAKGFLFVSKPSLFDGLVLYNDGDEDICVGKLIDEDGNNLSLPIDHDLQSDWKEGLTDLDDSEVEFLEKNSIRYELAGYN